MQKSDDILVAEWVKNAKERGNRKIYGPSLRESSSLHTFIKTKEQGERLMKLLKLMEEGKL